ncbi:MAG: hypothetical protein HC853_17865, partial [Anaerolineae bacterium]|nr:hypothetical protein [Anaerolineae bacterium]
HAPREHPPAPHPNATPGAAHAAATSAPGESGPSTLEQVSNAVLPREDLSDLAVRYKGLSEEQTQVTCSTTATEFEIGATRAFTLSNQDTDTQFQITARLEYKTEHVYMWVETEPTRIRLNARNLRSAADEFESGIYQTNRAFFGSEAQPGVDCDPRLYVLHASGIGLSVGGYFSSPDGFPRAVRSDSNEAEMFVMHAAPGYNGSDPGSTSYMSTMAHEFQHMISYNNTHAGNLWLEEGAAQLSERLNGYADSIGTTFDFASAPETQLNTWSESSAGENSAHYGAGYLFWSYFYDRFGEDVTKKLAQNKERDIGAFMKVLADEGVTNPDTNAAFSFEEIFADFAIANFMNQTKIEETGNRYNYASIDLPVMTTRGSFSNVDYPLDSSETLNQFGTHYYELKGESEVELSFTGSTVVPLLPMDDADVQSAGKFWYSMRADASNPRLTRKLDLSALNAGDKATLKFKAWYRFEKDYDYGYASVSEDGGTTWTLLKTTSCTTENPQNANLGCGWNGPSNPTGDTNQPQWTDEEADLSDYSGKTVLLRFEAVSDAGVNREGMAIDDLEIPEIEFKDSADDDNAWQAEGFVRVDNLMPQGWQVQLIVENKDGSRKLERVALTDGAGSTRIDFSGDVERVVLAVSPTTQVTTEQGSYQLQVK